MSDPQDSNSQAPTLPPTPAPQPGPSVEELQAKMVELERQSEGRLRDLQDERRKRQELEARTAPPAPAPSAAQPDVTQDELGKVLNPYIAPLKNKLQETEARLARYEEEEVIGKLAKNEGKTPEALRSDTAFQEKLFATARKWGLAGTPAQVAMKAYDLMKMEDQRVADTERSRQVAAAQAASMPAGSPPAPVAQQKQFTPEEFSALPLSQFDDLSKKGMFKKTSSGTFVYTPHKS